MKQIFFLIAFGLSLHLLAQDTIATKVIVFDDNDLSKYSGEKSKSTTNALKFNPLLIINGELPIYYERSLNNSFSVEGAIGVTFKNYIYALDVFDNRSTLNAVSTVETNKSAVSFKLGLRYYTGENVMEGWYFALEYAKRKYPTELTINYDIANNPSLQTITLNTLQSYNEFKLIAGSQSYSYWGNFFIDYYLGVGVRKQNNINAVATYDNATGNNIYTAVAENKTSLAFYTGLKLGFSF